MNRETVTLFLALLAVATQAAMVIAVAFALSARWRDTLIRTVGPVGPAAAAAVATVSMVGSLYFSEVAHFLPCKLCWYQRIAMYPCAIILLIALVRRDTSVRPYVGALAAIGAAISAYHILIERFPSLESSSCDPNNPCSLKWVEELGYVTIPVMALTGFVSIVLLLVVHRCDERRSVPSTPGV